MSTFISTRDLEALAVAALRSLLSEVSVIKLKDITCESQTSGDGVGLIAHVEVLGHGHTLVCGISSSAQPQTLRSTLRQFHDSAAYIDSAATPVIIAPHMSLEAQAMCKESHAGFLDFDGNARIALGEVFIGKRSMGPRAPQLFAASTAQAVEPPVLKQFPPARGGIKAADYPPIAIPA